MFKWKNHKLFYILVLTTALLLALTSIALAAVWTDQPDYAPGSMVTISGDNSDNAGYVSGEEVQVEVWGPNGYHEFCNPPGVADDNGAWSCQVTLWDNELALGNYNYTATGQSSGVSQSGIFTDAAVRLKFATIGLPVGTSVTVSWTRYIPGCNSTTGTGSTTFLAASPSAQVQACELDEQNSFSYSFPVSLVSGGLTYALSSSTPASGSAFTTDTTITATYAQACTPPAVTTNPSSLSITYGSDASFTVAGTNYTSVKWQVSTDGGTSWSDVSGSTSLTLTLTKPDVSASGYKYHAVLTGSCGSPATSTAATLTVNAALVTLTAGSYSGTYDGIAHSPSACVVTGTYKGALTCTDNPTSVGPNVSSGTVSPVVVLNGETATNFAITPVNGAYSITAAPVTMTAGSYSGTYDGSAHPPSACGVSGTYKGALTCTNNPASVGPNMSSGDVAPVLVLNSETASNFSVTPTNGAYDITPALVTMTAGSYSGTYDGIAHSPSACVVTGTFKGALTCTNNPASVGPNVSSGTVSPVVVLNGETATNFTVTPVNGAYSITAAPVTMTAGSYSGTYDGTAHLPVTCAVTAIAPNTYTGDLSCANDPASVGPGVGSGAVTPVVSGTGLANFDITSVNGSWSISKAPVTITSGSYNGTFDGSAHSPSACVVTPDSPNTYKGALTCTNDPSSVGADVGSGYVAPVLVLGGESESNFSVTPVNGAYSITPAPVTLTAGSYSGTFDGIAHSPSACVVSGTYKGVLTCTNSPDSVGADVGSGAVAPVLVLNGETASNFSVTPVNGSWSIIKADPVCTITGYNVYFDNNSHTATGSCLGVLNETLSGLDLSGTTHKLVGVYNDTWLFIDVTGNYNNASGSVTDTIKAWTLLGFYQPVDMNGVFNTVKNGSTVPLKFEIFAGVTELTDIGYVKEIKYGSVACDASAPNDAIETLATGNTSLRYDTTAGQFIYNWKTPKVTGCFSVTMTTLDGSSLVAFFKLK